MLKKHIILDFDGVILKSDLLYSEISKKIFKTDNSLKDFSDIISSGGQKLFNTIAGRKASSNDIKKFRQSQIDLFEPQRHLFDSVLECIEKLSTANKLSILSNKPKMIILNMLIKAKIDFFFDNIIGIDSGFKKKPSPEGLIYLKNLYKDYEPVFIGDALSDYQTAKESFVDFIYCAYGYGDINLTSLNKINQFNDLLIRN